MYCALKEIIGSSEKRAPIHNIFHVILKYLIVQHTACWTTRQHTAVNLNQRKRFTLQIYGIISLLNRYGRLSARCTITTGDSQHYSFRMKSYHFTVMVWLPLCSNIEVCYFYINDKAILWINGSHTSTENISWHMHSRTQISRASTNGRKLYSYIP